MGKYFGTDGFRGTVNKKLTAEHAFKIGRFLGSYADKKNKVIIVRDSRLSGSMLATALISGILSSGGETYDLGISTTPSVSYLLQKHDFDFGVMISASHNPYFDNGIKVFNRHGEKISASLEDEIEAYIDSPTDTLALAINENIGRYFDAKEMVNEYIDFLASKFEVKIQGLKILIDCANGSASAVIDCLLKKINLKADVIHAEPNGININNLCGSTHIDKLSSVVKEGGYDCAFAFDGDADRCLAMDEDGHIVDGDAIMFINALHMKKTKKLNDNAIVLTVMSNIGLKKALSANKIDIYEVGVGDKYVQAELKKRKLSLGGEQSGHIIFFGELNTGDGLLTMIKLLNVIAKDMMSLKELTSELTIYPQCLKNIVVVNKEAILSDEGFNQKIDEMKKALNGEGRILVRASGTEPLIRVMCEAKTDEICQNVCDELISYIGDIQ